MTIQIRQTSASASEAAIRHHRVPIDRPVEKGGADRGPMGGELFLAAVGGCFMSNVLAAIAARQAPISDVVVDVSGTMEGTPPRFSQVSLTVSAESADPDQLSKVIEIAERGCIMVNTLRASLELTVGTRKDPTWGADAGVGARPPGVIQSVK